MSKAAYIKNNSGNKKQVTVNQHNDTVFNNNKARLKTLVVNGEKYRTTFSTKFAKRKKWIKPDDKKVISFIPCTIIKVFVHAGQKINRNDEMLIMEAMKMQNTIHSPIKGTIKNVNIKAGDKIPKGFVMIDYK
jgi:biotin carboxyl carrier protein